VISFEDLALAEPIRRALQQEGYAVPTPIQVQAIPQLLAGRDLLGIAQTGTGKTAAFALPILQHLAAEKPTAAGHKTARALVLTPTRELALQIVDSFRAYGRYLGMRATAIFGGVGQQPQVAAMARGIDILVATPGRLLDLIGQGHVRLDGVETLVLDEADRMLDMGFLHDVKKIVGLARNRRQTLLFSATMPPDIARLAAGILHQPVRIEVTPPATTVELIEQRVLFVERADKRQALCGLLTDPGLARVLIFTRTKHTANRVAEQLERSGFAAEAIHGNKSQGARQRALEAFRAGTARILVATDIAARGIDVEGITHVINYELPNIPETYVHRIGRTARAGAGGAAISLCDGEERAYLRDIERLIGRKVPVLDRRETRGAAPPRRAA
jgi:ATP-dependent RNA helicase RhlE